MKNYKRTFLILPLSLGCLAWADATQSAQKETSSEVTALVSNTPLSQAIIDQRLKLFPAVKYFHKDASAVIGVTNIINLIESGTSSYFLSYLMDWDEARDLDDFKVDAANISFGSSLSHGYQFPNLYTKGQGTYLAKTIVKSFNPGRQDEILPNSMLMLLFGTAPKFDLTEENFSIEQDIASAKTITNQFKSLLNHSFNAPDSLLTAVVSLTDAGLEDVSDELENLPQFVNSMGNGVNYYSQTIDGIDYQGLSLDVNYIFSETLEELNSYLHGELRQQEEDKEITQTQKAQIEEQIKSLDAMYNEIIAQMDNKKIYVLIGQNENDLIIRICTEPEKQAIQPKQEDSMIASNNFNMVDQSEDAIPLGYFYCSEAILNHLKSQDKPEYKEWSDGLKIGFESSLAKIDDQTTHTLPDYADQWIKTLSQTSANIDKRFNKATGGATAFAWKNDKEFNLDIKLPYSVILSNNSTAMSGVDQISDSIVNSYGSFDKQALSDYAQHIVSWGGLLAYTAKQHFMNAYNEDQQEMTHTIKTAIGLFDNVVAPNGLGIVQQITKGIAPQFAGFAKTGNNEKIQEAWIKATNGFPQINMAVMAPVDNVADLSEAWKPIEPHVTQFLSLVLGPDGFICDEKDGTTCYTAKLPMKEIQAMNPVFQRSTQYWSFAIPGAEEATLKKAVTDNKTPKNGFNISLNVNNLYELIKQTQNIIIKTKIEEGWESTKLLEMAESLYQDAKSIEFNAGPDNKGGEQYQLKVRYQKD